MMVLASDETRILPVWHHVTGSEVAQYSPILAGRVGVSTSRGLAAVAREIVKASFSERVERLGCDRVLNLDGEDLNTARDKFRALLETNPPVGDVRLFLSAYNGLLNGIRGYSPILIDGHQLGSPAPFDFAMIAPDGWSGSVEVPLIVLGPTKSLDIASDVQTILTSAKLALGPMSPPPLPPVKPFSGGKVPQRPAIIRPTTSDWPLEWRIALNKQSLGRYPKFCEAFQVDFVKRQRALKKEERLNVQLGEPERWTFSILVLVGRRDDESIKAREEYARRFSEPTVASYDRLLDAGRPSNEK